MKIFSLVIATVLFSFYTTAQTLPAFSFTKSNKQKITPASLPENKPIVVCYFNPFCDKCETQAAKIKEKAAKFAGITLVYVSSEASLEENEAFRKKYFTSMPNVFVCKDEEFKFDTWFGYSEAPSIYVYNKARNRTAVFTAVVTVEEILDACSKTM